MQLLGLLIILNSIIITGWLVKSGQVQGKLAVGGVCAVCLIAVFVGIVLMILNRVTEVIIPGVGTIKAASEQAKVDAEEIGKIRNRIESQSATVDLVAQHANEAKALSEDLAKKQEIAETRMKEIEGASEEAQKILGQLREEAELISTISAAQNDDREAYDRLRTWAEDKEHPFSDRAARAYSTIMDSHSEGMYSTGLRVPWPEGLDPSTLTLDDLKVVYRNFPVWSKPAIIEYVYGRNDISKFDKIEFLIEIIRNDKSLNAVEYAGRYFTQGASLQIKPVAIDYLLSWWEQNKDSFREEPQTSPGAPTQQ